MKRNIFSGLKRRLPQGRNEISVLSGDALGAAVGGGFALGEPPVQKPGNPGVVAQGMVLLSSAPNLGEQLATNSGTAK